MRIFWLSVLALGVAPIAAAVPPDATSVEFLWQLNLARSDPAAWGADNGLGTLLDAIAPMPPLARNETLVASAQAKAQEFVDYDYFDHQSPVTGSPNQLIVGVFLYPLAGNTGFFFGPGCSPCSYGSFGNTGVESLASSFGPDGGLFSTARNAVWGLLGEICDTLGTPGSCGTVSHRNHLLGAAALTAPMIEAGAAHVVEPETGSTTHYWVLHTGFPAGNVASMPQILTGVVYADGDGDERYDAGEGLGGVTIQANALSTTSNPGGDWSLPVANGSYDVSCAGGAFVGTATAVGVAVADANREVDCRSGVAQPTVDFAPEPAQLCAGLAAHAALMALARRRCTPRQARRIKIAIP